ncbi:alpha/beta hydrolase [Bremerella cremea]|uniref:alpha/beta hydrolase n=1 Tax=Bremerella cremea TaxID=1031537 RepID=UPI0031E688A2
MNDIWITSAIMTVVLIGFAAGIRILVRKLLSGTYKAGEIVDPYRPRNFSLPDPLRVEFAGEKSTTLRGRFWQGSSDKAIVVVHGIDGPSLEMMPHVSYLFRAGYSVLLYDNRGRGDSEGGFSTLGFLEWRDVLHAVDWIRRQPGVDPRLVGLHGLSLGAACVIMAAAKDRDIRGVLAESPFVSMTIMLGHVANKLTRVPRKLIGGFLRTIVDWSLGTRLRLVEPRTAVKQISPRPIFIIDAEEDQLFPENTSQTVYDTAGPPKTFWKVSGASHANCWHTRPEEYEQRAIEFWEEVFQGDLAAGSDEDAETQHEAISAEEDATKRHSLKSYSSE